MEIWKDIEGYVGKYQVSNLGRVKSEERTVLYKSKYGKCCERTQEERIIAQHIKSNGYKSVALYKDNKMKNFYVHRLVAQAFIENPDNKETVNHKDFDKENNNVFNLEWNTLQENVSHAALNDVYVDNGGVEVKVVYSNNKIDYYPTVTKASKGIGCHRDTLHKYWHRGYSSRLEELGVKEVIRI